MKSRFVIPRAKRTALIVASVPLDTKRIFSMNGMTRVISVASSSSSSVVTPKLVPRRAWSAIASAIAGLACPRMIAAPLDHQRFPAHGPKRPHGAAHAADQNLFGALEDFTRTPVLALHLGLRCTHLFLE